MASIDYRTGPIPGAHYTEDRVAILDRECSADVELCPHFKAVLEAQYQINDSLKQPCLGSDDREKPWLA